SKSSDVVAVDINPYAIRCAKLNAKKNKVDSRIKFLNSDLFEEVKGKFDLIIFDPPFRWFTPRDMLERSVADKNYSTLTAFFRSAKKYLNENGRILIFFGTSGDLNYLKFLIKKHEFKKKEMARKELKKNGRKYVYYTYKLSVS
ncbi:MAG: methylase, partial [Candidatus Aenigmarchaeota archaeon CG01_land_8_20_14_3_00_37_9]